MKEKRKEKSYSDKHKKKKKHKKKYVRSSTSDSELNEEMQWVEASSIQNQKKKVKKKKKKYKKKSSSSDSESSDSHDKSLEIKKGKYEKRNEKYESSSSSDSETTASEQPKNDSLSISSDKEKRDSWMNEETFVPTLSKSEMFLSSARQKRLDSVREQREKEQKIQEERELNPHWKNEGTGLPDKEASVASLSLPSTSVGDGGYGWLKKAYYRIQEQAQQEGRSMEEVAVERWGSLSKLTSLIEEAEERMKSHPDWKKMNYRHGHNRYDRTDRYHQKPFRKPDENSDSHRNFETSYEFRKPSGDSRSKVVNQFKSSKKSDRSYEPSNERSSYRTSDFDEKTKDSESRIPSWKKPSFKDSYEKDQPQSKNSSTDRKASDSGNHIPAWKKFKPSSEEKKVQIMETSSQEISDNGKDECDLPIICSEEDLSKLAAQQIKAEMFGDTELAEKLKAQLEEAKRIVKEKGFAKQSSKKVEEVVLTKMDSQGLARPLQTTQEQITSYKQKKSNKYFDESSSYSLKEMFEKEKLTTADDHMEMFVEASSECNETAELDYESGKISKKLSQKMGSGRQEERDIGRAMQQHQKRVTSLERCGYCLDQPRMKKHLIVDIGEEVYLSLPNYQTMTEGHCLIVPKAHVQSFLSLDENEWREVNDFKNQLRTLFRSENKSVIFLETSMNFRHFPHAFLECIPVPEEEGDMAPFYFKKAIQESEEEWAHNKKLVDLTSKGLRYSVPKNLPYFHVEFDPKVHAGYAHVIEEEKYFPRNFGKEVVGGMLDIDYNHLYKNKKEDTLKKAQEVVEFQKKWKKFKEAAS